jgi:glycosyltransferase involved in cell wall biosynthesis
MKKNILFIIESSETGGAETVFAELVQRINREHFNLHVALLYEGWLFDRLKSEGLEPILIPNRKGGFDFKLLQGISKIIKRHSIDLIHSHLFTTNVYASVCGTIFRVPVISTFHGTMDVAEQDRGKKIKWQIINRYSSKIVFVSRYLQDYFVGHQLANSGKSIIIYNGIDIERFQRGPSKVEAKNRLGLMEKNFVIGCVGDLRPAKDYETALRAVGLLKPKIGGLKLVIAGTKTKLLHELQVLRDSLGLGNDVEFLGFRSDIEKVFPAFDLYLSSSTSEGFSLTVVEALAAGLPVVSTRSGGPEEIIRHGENGLLVEAGAPEIIAAAIARIYQDHNARAAFRRAGLLEAEAKFSVQAMVDRYQNLYMELCR